MSGLQPVTLNDLAALPRWVCWQSEDRSKGGPTKVPYDPNRRGKAMADKPATWGTRAAAEERFGTLPRPYGDGGVGFELGDLGDGRCVAGIDLDTCRDDAGTFTPWALAVVDRFATYTEISPSGTGCKLFFMLNADDMRSMLPLLKLGVVFRDGKAKHPPGIELYTGGRYFTVTGQHLAGTPAELVPVSRATVEWLLTEAGPALKAKAAKKAGPASTAKGRSEAALRKGAELRRSGASYDQMVQRLRADPATAEWVQDKGDAANGRELRRIWEKAGLPPPTVGGHDLTEDGLALAFAEAHQDTLRYDHTRGAWFKWTGVAWRQDVTRLAFAWSRNICRNLARDAGADGGLLSTMAKAATAAAVERFAQSDPGLAVTSEIWDRDTFLLGTPGGTIDLRTGRMRQPSPDDHISKLTAVTPADKADCPLWLEFLDQVAGEDAELIRFLRQWAGYCLTGDTREQALLFVYGDGGNGKGVLLNTLAGIMGEYATNAPMETFAASKTDRHPTDIAGLAGSRMVTASETEEGREWAQDRINALTGGDPISARFMRQDFFTFKPGFKLTLIGNYRPVLKNVDAAAKRRFNMVPFKFVPVSKDLELETKLQAEAPAILRWMIEGCLDWQRHRLLRPRVVAEATAEYFEEQDIVNQWVAECCTLAPYSKRQFDTLAVLFKSWSHYAVSNGERAGTTKWFSQTLKRLGCTPVKNTLGQHGKRGFTGISVKIPPLGNRGEDDRDAAE